MKGADGQNLVEQIDRLINGEGDPCKVGCEESEVDAMIAYCKDTLGKKYCLVSRWSWADLAVSPEDNEAIEKSGFKPSFIYASNIIRDEAGRWSPGMSVKSTLLTAFTKNCIFVTANTAYILVGPGTRLRVSPTVYTNLHF